MWSSFRLQKNHQANEQSFLYQHACQSIDAGDTKQALADMAQLYPIGRIGKAHEVANVIYFLACDQASFVVGATWSVDGGISSY